MVPQSRRPKSDHPLPLWLRLGLVLFVVLLVIGATFLWVIQGTQAIVPIALLTALSILIALFQSFPALFPLREHEQDTRLPSLPSPDYLSPPSTLSSLLPTHASMSSSPD